MSDQFQSNEGVTLHAHRWEVGTSKASVLIVHGYGHHGGSFSAVAERFNAAGLSVFAFDQRGHGKSGGRRGHIATFQHQVDDVGSCLDHYRAALVGRPVFLMGHSLGCLALGLYVVNQKPTIDGLIFSSGLLKIPDSVPVLLQKLAGVLATVTPWLPVQYVDATATSRDPIAVTQLVEDPLRCRPWMNARTGASIARAVAQFQSRMQEITDPLLIFHGTADRLTDPEGSRQLHARAGSRDKTLRVFEDGYHELYNDLEKEQFVREVVDWINARIADPIGPGHCAPVQRSVE
jgi:alpha-beta hydrolase superfamily lysophospholipase